MNIGITLKKSAYVPEAYAYKQYLESYGHHIQLDYILDPDNDINIYYMGFIPFWKTIKGKSLNIHEYHSLSTPPIATLKNFFKKTVNKKPNGRIFLNKIVEQEMGFRDKCPTIYRDMGVDESFFCNSNEKERNIEFDLVYSGRINNRTLLINTLCKLSKKNKILVIGEINNDTVIKLKHKNIVLTGKVERNQLPELYQKARFGLNCTPDLYPYNIQTSTKTLEYLASGLHLVTNRYKWIENFCYSIGYQPIWLNNDLILDQHHIKQVFPDMSCYSWFSILKQSGLNNFLQNLQ